MAIQIIKRDLAKAIFAHVLIIALVISYETWATLTFGVRGSFWDYACYYVLNICFFYANAFFIIKYALNRSNVIVRVILFTIIGFSLYSFFFLSLGYILKYNKIQGFPTKKQIEFEFARSVFRGIMVLLYSMVYCFARYVISQIKLANRIKLEKAEAERQKVHLQNRMLLAENALLEAQIQTHLLFNTLSYVYDKTMDLPGGPGEAVLILNDVMRYSLKKVPADGKMPINEEIEHIRNIVRLGELRHDEGLFIEVETENVDNPEYRIIASMLSTFVENMFKYGDLKDPITPATVSAKVEGDIFSFRATNKKTARSGQESHKIGLDNVRRRLQYAYDSFSLIVTDNPDEFIIDLKVPV